MSRTSQRVILEDTGGVITLENLELKQDRWIRYYETMRHPPPSPQLNSPRSLDACKSAKVDPQKDLEQISLRESLNRVLGKPEAIRYSSTDAATRETVQRFFQTHGVGMGTLGEKVLAYHQHLEHKAHRAEALQRALRNRSDKDRVKGDTMTSVASSPHGGSIARSEGQRDHPPLLRSETERSSVSSSLPLPIVSTSESRYSTLTQPTELVESRRSVLGRRSSIPAVESTGVSSTSRSSGSAKVRTTGQETGSSSSQPLDERLSLRESAYKTYNGVHFFAPPALTEEEQLRGVHYYCANASS